MVASAFPVTGSDPSQTKLQRTNPLYAFFINSFGWPQLAEQTYIDVSLIPKAFHQAMIIWTNVHRP